MVIPFPPSGTSQTVQHRWDAATIAAHSPEFAQHYRLASLNDSEGTGLWCDVTLAATDDTSVTVTGQAGFTPTLACGRCLKEGPLAVQSAIDVSVRLKDASSAGRAVSCAEDALPADMNDGGTDKELDTKQLDIYAVEDGAIDLLQIVRDAVDFAVPEPVTFRDDAGYCGLCKQTVADALVASGGDTEAVNPFAALKGLKDQLKN